MIINLLFFISGLGILFYGAELLIDNGKKLAIKMAIPPIVIGITLVAFGTSLPEMIVSLIANLKGEDGIAIGNIIGSNIANIGLVLGIASITTPIYSRFKNIKRDFSFLICVTFIFSYICYMGDISRTHGLLFITLLVSYLFILFKKNEEDNFNNPVVEKIYMTTFWIIISISSLYIGTELFIKGAIGIAHSLGVSNTSIGLTIVALGTSAPELATTLSAAKRKEHDMIIGNIIGSNLFNILAVIGVTAIFNTIFVEINEIKTSLIIFNGLTCLLLINLMAFNKLSRVSGAICFSIYLTFLYVVYQY